MGGIIYSVVYASECHLFYYFTQARRCYCHILVVLIAIISFMICRVLLDAHGFSVLQQQYFTKYHLPVWICMSLAFDGVTSSHVPQSRIGFQGRWPVSSKPWQALYSRLLCQRLLWLLSCLLDTKELCQEHKGHSSQDVVSSPDHGCEDTKST